MISRLLTCTLRKVHFFLTSATENTLDKEGRAIAMDCKVYRQQYIWGQIVGWFKQTVNNPEASLSQDRRGTLSYPSFEVSFKVADQKSLSYPFQRGIGTARSDFLRHLKEKPAVNWPPRDVKWSFKNSQKFVFQRNL